MLGRQRNSPETLENRTSGAEALSDCILYGTAEAEPLRSECFPPVLSTPFARVSGDAFPKVYGGVSRRIRCQCLQDAF